MKALSMKKMGEKAAAYPTSLILTLGLMFSAAFSTPAHSATPIIAPPANYGHYCSLKYPGGGWALGVLPGTSSTPCENILASSPGGSIARAGLWDTTGQNNVLLTCDGLLLIFRGSGSSPIDSAFNGAFGKKNCQFTVSPTRLPIFSAPYGKTNPVFPSVHTDVVRTSSLFNYNVYHIDMDRTMFGQPFDSGDPNAHWVDRYGKFRSAMHESAYDWSMPGGKPLVAVAPGRIIESRDRDVTQFGCGPDKQKEIYIEHQVGSGIYAEKFVTYYAHLSVRNVVRNQNVVRGQLIGRVGTTGCSSGNHLHMSFMRTTNLSGNRFWNFAVTPSGYGVNGIQGVIDPYGWAAPQHVDPWGWMYQGKTIFDSVLNRNVTNPGAFSINLWRPGAAPPIALF